MSARQFEVPSFADMKTIVHSKLGITPCTWQLQSALHQLEKKNVFTISPTGSGKTFTFWIPLLFNDNGIILIVTPLNILGEKTHDEAKTLGFPAYNLSADNATDEAFNDIAKLKYRVITVSPERVLGDTRFKNLWNSKRFTSALFNVTFDEGHCISEWGKDFRPLYSELGNLRWFLPDHVSFHTASATMPPHVLHDVHSKLHIRSYNTTKIIRSNDRPNIHLMVEEMKYSRSSMHDLTRIFSFNGTTPHEKFMLFTNSRDKAEIACSCIHLHMPPQLRDKVVWFHSGMSMDFRVDAMDKLRRGDIWGVCCTDTAGMGLDLRDITLVIQWGYTPSLCTLMQRLGRAARDPLLTALAVYFVEPLYFDTYRGKRKRPSPQGHISLPARKRAKEKNKASNSRLDREDSEPEDHGGAVSDAEENVEEDMGRDNTAERTHRGLAASTHPQDPPGSTEAVAKILPSGLDNDAIEQSAMYAFINAHLRGLCRRKVADEYFNNPSIDQADSSSCCARCSVKLSRYCCDICNPATLQSRLFPSLPLPSTRAKRKFTIKPYEMTTGGQNLRQELLQWRNFKVLEEDLDGDDFFGPQIIMSNKILD
ncbi:P-loop containing nucleoside triphosphate hydrolase protein [Suillus brevipes Sb2]|nr:P-loop containing nucleoside triphosphate hydrolase protein [Suillus brevipes Sb2]